MHKTDRHLGISAGLK